MSSKGGLPEVAKKPWREMYERTPYRKLPWFSAKPFAWVERGVREAWIPHGARVLDVGTGAGTNSIFLSKSGYKVSGIDLAPVAIAAARARATRIGASVDFRVADATSTPFPKSRFGGLIDVGCFHTLPIPFRDRYAAEMARILRPGGRFLLAWAAREFTAAFGPPHRPSVDEVCRTFEGRFQVLRTEFLVGRWARLPAYGALLERRFKPQPPPR